MVSATFVLVDTVPLLHSCLAALENTPSLAVDLEGVALCRSGTLCLVQLKALGSDTIWLIDIVVLRATAFEEIGASGQSLKSILESRSVKKVLLNHISLQSQKVESDFIALLRRQERLRRAVQFVRRNARERVRPAATRGRRALVQGWEASALCQRLGSQPRDICRATQVSGCRTRLDTGEGGGTPALRARARRSVRSVRGPPTRTSVGGVLRAGCDAAA